MNFSIRSKITAPYVLLSLAIAIGGAYIITQVILDSIEERFDNQVIETAQLTVEAFWREEENLLKTLRVIVNTEGMAQAALEKDPRDLRVLILPIFINFQDELVAILDKEGTSLLTITRPDNGLLEGYTYTQGDQQFQEFTAVQSVLAELSDQAGDKFAGYMVFNSKTYFLISAPLRDIDGDLIGVAIIGTSIDTLVQHFREATLAQVTIYDLDGAIIHSSLFSMPEIPQSNVDAVIANKSSESTSRDTTAENIEYREILFTWQARDNRDLGVIGTALATSFLVNTNTFTRINVFILTTFVLILVIVVGIYIANVITKPIITLKNAAADVSGGDLSVQVIPIGGDEISMLTMTFNDMVSNLRVSKQALVEAYDKTLEGWAKALELRDEDTEGHSQRVAQMTVDLAGDFGYGGEKLEHLRRGALLHDIGKMGIPDKILRKPGKLTKKEMRFMQQHPIIAKELIEQIEYLHPAMDIPYSHHEKWDGSGYPQGLRDEDIPKSARIFAVVDVWDAVRSKRPYRAAMTKKQALKIIRDGRGSHFDPEVVDAFLAYIE